MVQYIVCAILCCLAERFQYYVTILCCLAELIKKCRNMLYQLSGTSDRTITTPPYHPAPSFLYLSKGDFWTS